VAGPGWAEDTGLFAEKPGSGVDCHECAMLDPGG
jgi:hypothetical protein